MRNELDVRSYVFMPDMNGLPHLKVKSGQISPWVGWRRSCPRNKRMKKKAVAGPVYHSRSSLEEEEEGERLHQAELKAFGHHMTIKP